MIISAIVSLIHYYKSLSTVKASVTMILPVPVRAFKVISDQMTWSMSDLSRTHRSPQKAPGSYLRTQKAESYTPMKRSRSTAPRRSIFKIKRLWKLCKTTTGPVKSGKNNDVRR